MQTLIYDRVADEKFDVIGPSRNRSNGQRVQELKKVLGTDSQKDEIVISESETSVEEAANAHVSTPRNINGSLSNSRIPIDKSKNLRKVEEKLEHQQQDFNSEITDRAWVMKHFLDCPKSNG